MQKSNRKTTIFLAFDWRHGAIREILSGILRYAAMRPEWDILLGGDLPRDGNVSFRQPTKVDGAISGYGALYSLRRFCPQLPRAVVFLSGPKRRARSKQATPAIAHVDSNNAEIGRLGAALFLRRGGFASYGFVETPFRQLWSCERGESFAAHIRETGAACRIFRSLSRQSRPDHAQLSSKLARWIAALPKPAAVMAANDTAARLVVETCAATGVSVPEQVAVLGVDNMECFCESTKPGISSIPLDFVDGGFKAAETLDALLAGRPAPEGSRFYAPREPVERASTGDANGVRRIVQIAETFMREHFAWRGLGVEQIAAAAKCSRRHLEKCFHAALGKTPAERLREIRLANVRNLLAHTDKPIDRIAELSGLSQFHCMRAFRSAFGVTMGEYRRRDAE